MSRLVPNFHFSWVIINIEVFWVKQARVKRFALHLNQDEYQSFTKKKTPLLFVYEVYLKTPTFI